MAVSKQTIEFQAKEKAYLSLVAPVSLADLDRVFSLYLPFIGAKGYALYHFLVQENQAGEKQWNDHYLLLDTLTLSLPDLVHARQALEAVGLLKTFYQEAGAFAGYTYEIQPPLTAKAFFAEDLLAGLLFYYAGEDRYQVLAQRYAGQTAGQNHGDNVVNLSANFLELFDNPMATQRPRVALAGPQAIPDLDFKTEAFDFEAMTALVHGTTAELLAPDRQIIVTQQVLYGLNEAEMATAITRNLNLDNHRLNRPGFMAYLQENWGQTTTKTKLANQGQDRVGGTTQDSKSAMKIKDETTAAPASNQQANSAGLQVLFQAANQLSPIDFLRQIKENNHGYVTKAEGQLLTDLLGKNILPVPVINILIYQVLVNMGNSDLKRNLVDSIANDWAKLRVTSAEKAVEAIKNHQDRQKARTNTTNSNRRYQSNWSNRKEKVEPKMATNDQVKSQATQGEDEKALMALLANRRTKN
ncbi:DnaD domain protein [Fructobacillus ficulneus]|uniref:Replication initiation/membrane attachment protein n=1 Tax=Fructobacillus ficulneus TaxID=157463 RepID=A0A0K8MID1_9LACO|nr:DnaD domain protein [Fructobacillus ficulneus]GAO99624.1 replication initiation/membrane attachment protein [Fructobacillus ficulneus]